MKSLLAAIAAAALLTPAVCPAKPLTAQARTEAIAKLSAALIDNYVYPETGRRAAVRIRHRMAAGAYSRIHDEDAFAAAVSADLKPIAHDLHLRFATNGFAATMENRPETGQLGIARVDRLRGNIGYIDLTGFDLPVLFQVGAARAMKLVAGTDALILDLRHNRGGDAQSVADLAGFFFAADAPPRLGDIVWRTARTRTYTRQSFAAAPAPIHYDRPVYILTSADTFSAGEGFTYDMQALKRATVIGQVTAGGAHPTMEFPIGDDFVALIPIGYAQSPITRTSWEGKGVTPDHITPTDDAFATAYLAATHATNGAHITLDAVSEQSLPYLRTTENPGERELVQAIALGLAEGNPPYARLGDDLAQMTRDRLPQLQANLQNMGDFQSIAFSQSSGGLSIYVLTYTKGRIEWRSLMDDDGKEALAAFHPL